MAESAKLHRWSDIPREKLNKHLERRMVTGEVGSFSDPSFT